MKHFFFSLLLLLQIPMIAAAQEAYAVYSNRVLTFYYDNLRSTRKGTIYDLNTGKNDPGWNDWRYSTLDIRKVVFSPSFAEARPTSTYSWFSFGKYVDSTFSEIIGLQYLNTSNVTDMSWMFSGCKLKNIDVSHFDTSKVTDMSYMFEQCLNLTTLDVSHFDTSNVTDMRYMFEFCESLETLDVSHFDTGNVKNMQAMFHNCKTLQFLDVSHFNTSSVTNMNNMFSYCENLTNLDVANFDTGNVTDMGRMFSTCKKCTELNVSGFNTSNVINMRAMFWQCKKINSLDVSNFDTSNVDNFSMMFGDCNNLEKIDVSNFNTIRATKIEQMFYGCNKLQVIDISNFDTRNVMNMGGMFDHCSSLTSLDVSSFITEKVTNMHGMFYWCTSLTALDLSNFNTANVTSMGSMFAGCSSLTSLDVSNFNTANVTDMSEMFYNCRSLTSLDLSNFNTAKVTDMNEMFYGCGSLMTIYADEAKWSTAKVTEGNNMFYNCTSLVGGAGTKYDANHVGVSYAHIDGGPSNPGYLTDKNSSTQEKEAYATRSDDGKTVTFYYDNQKANRSNVREINNRYVDSEAYGYGTTAAVFDASFSDYRPTSTAYWFINCGNLTSITGMEYLNTENVTNMQYMFFSCSKITSLDLSHFNTANVKDMDRVFFNCSSLTSLDVSNFNTENVTNMSGMFSGCSTFTSLDLSNFNTASVTAMDGMFYGCSALAAIYADKDKWSTAKVTSSDGMFLNCTSLVGGAGTKYDANHVDKAYAHIDGGPSNPGYFTDKNAGAEEEVCDADDLLRFIESLSGTTTTNDNPAEATLCDEPTIDQDVDIEDDLWLYLYGDDDTTPPVMNFYGGAINLKSRNGGWTFKGVGFTNNGGALAPQRAAGGSGGITSVGTLTFDGCTLMEGDYTVQNLSDGRMYLLGGTIVEGQGNLINSGNVYIDGSVKVADLVNKKGGRIYVTSALTKDLKVSIATAADVEQGVAIILGGNGYTMTAADVSHITLTLPDGFEWKYNEAAGGIVVNSASGISALEQQKVVVEDYDILGRKVSKNIKGLHIQQMNDGTVKKVITN